MRRRVTISLTIEAAPRRGEGPSTSVTFSLSPKEYEEAQLYAVTKGFVSVDELARYSLFRFQGQYPVDGRKHGRKGEDSPVHGNGAQPTAEALPESPEATSGRLNAPAKADPVLHRGPVSPAEASA